MPSYTNFILLSLIFILPAARALNLKDIKIDPNYDTNVAIGKKLDVHPGIGELVDEDGRKYQFSCDDDRCELKFISGDIHDESDQEKRDRPVCDSLRYTTSPKTIRGLARRMALSYKAIAGKFWEEKQKYLQAVATEHADPDRVFEREEINRLRHMQLAKLEMKVRAAALEIVVMSSVTKNFTDFSGFEGLKNLAEIAAHADNLIDQSFVRHDADGALTKLLDPNFALPGKDYFAGETRCEHAHCLEGACNFTMHRKMEGFP